MTEQTREIDPALARRIQDDLERHLSRQVSRICEQLRTLANRIESEALADDARTVRPVAHVGNVLHTLQNGLYGLPTDSLLAACDELAKFQRDAYQKGLLP